MKSFSLGFTTIILIALIAVSVLYFRQCSNSQEILDNSKEKAELLKKNKDLEQRLTLIMSERDSLLKLPAKIKTQIIVREREINESIAKDSANARKEFNQALTENNILPDPLPDNPHYVSFRDLGNSAILMAKIPKLELTIKDYEKVVTKDEEAFENYKSQIGGLKDLRELDALTIKSKNQQIADLDSFWHNDWLWFGIGVLASGVTVYLLK